MTEEQRFEQFIELCKRIFERMERDGSWPWLDDETKRPPDDGGTLSMSNDNHI